MAGKFRYGVLNTSRLIDVIRRDRLEYKGPTPIKITLAVTCCDQWPNGHATWYSDGSGYETGPVDVMAEKLARYVGATRLILTHGPERDQAEEVKL